MMFLAIIKVLIATHFFFLWQVFVIWLSLLNRFWLGTCDFCTRFGCRLLHARFFAFCSQVSKTLSFFCLATLLGRATFFFDAIGKRRALRRSFISRGFCHRRL